MGCLRKTENRSFGRKLLCFLITISIATVAIALSWYFLFFTKDVDDIIADCGGCHCIPDNSTSFKCPLLSTLPSASYPEGPYLNAWKSQTILNPYTLNCNPYEDGVFCDTEPPLDPDFQWAKLGETAVCAIHYESQEEEQELDAVEGRINGINEPFLKTQAYAIALDLDEDQGNFTNIPLPEACDETTFYRVKTYPSRKDAENAGGFVTHIGHCGVCSTLQDLAVYSDINFVGLTSPGNFCRRQASVSFENGIACYQGMGMTYDCAKIWADTSWNTAKHCFRHCVVNPTVPLLGRGEKDTNSTEATTAEKWYDLPATLRNRFFSQANEIENLPKVQTNGPAPECALNDCITCNDDVSAPTFERFAGRSRRRSGLLSSEARECNSIPLITHEPCPNTMPLSE